MATTQSHAKDVSTDAQPTDLGKRSIKALTTPMTTMTNVADVEPPEYEVTSSSGSAYIVDVEAGTCTCPDHEYRGVDCAHLRRVRYETARDAIPGWVNTAMLDDQLGEHIDETPRVAMADGGVAAARSEAEPVSEQADDLAGKIGYVIGVDATGAAHAHHPAADEVRVYDVGADYEVGDRLDEDDVEHVQDLGDRPLTHWMEYVADRRGWETTTHRAPEGFGGDE